MSIYMSDRQILSFYKKRRVIYKQIKAFTGFFLLFLVLMSYILPGSWFLAFSVSLILLVIYGVIAICVLAERKFSYLCDDSELFSYFIKLNHSAVFDFANFVIIVKADDESEICEQK